MLWPLTLMVAGELAMSFAVVFLSLNRKVWVVILRQFLIIKIISEFNANFFREEPLVAAANPDLEDCSD